MNLDDCGMQLIRLSEITTEPEASVETLLGMLSEHIDTLADASHYFVIDPSNTTLQSASISDVSLTIACVDKSYGDDVRIVLLPDSAVPQESYSVF